MSRRLGLATALFVVGGCGPISGAATPLPTTPATPGVASVAPSRTPAATPEPTAVAFQSDLYPYSLELPGGWAYGPWRVAAAAWNEDLSIYRGSSNNDEINGLDGWIFVLGLPWEDDAAAFEDAVLANLAAGHECVEPFVRRAITVDGEPATAMTQVCGGTVVYARALVLHRDVALLINLGAVASDRRDEALDLLIGLLDGLRWRDAASGS